jgi:hypothetical protein
MSLKLTISFEEKIEYAQAMVENILQMYLTQLELLLGSKVQQNLNKALLF